MKKTVGLELALFDREKDRYVMVGREIGPADSMEFWLSEKTKVKVLISLYPGWAGEVTARPVIFRED